MSVVFSVRVLGGQAWTISLRHTSHGKGAARNKPICEKICFPGTTQCFLLKPTSAWSNCATPWTHVLSASRGPLLRERAWQHTRKDRATGTVFLQGVSYCTLLAGNFYFPFMLASALADVCPLCTDFSVWVRFKICCLLAQWKGAGTHKSWHPAACPAIAWRAVHLTSELHFSTI